MKKTMRSIMLALVTASATLFPGVVEAADTTTQLLSFTSGSYSQEVGYAGLGNSNELLSTACVTFRSATTPTINFSIFGNANAKSAEMGLGKFIKNIKLYARKRDAGKDYTTDASRTVPENTFAHIYDYRDPVNNLGAILLASTTDLTVTSLTSNVQLASGDYVIYLVADIKSEKEIGGLENLPAIKASTSNFTRIGGAISKVGDVAMSNRVGQDLTSAGGGRVIIPKCEILFLPKYEGHSDAVDYSKYYRIPAITRAADGSLVALSDARKNHIHDVPNDIDIVARRSTDNGKTWNTPFVVFEGNNNNSTNTCEDDAGYGDASVAAFSNGTVLACAIAGNALKPRVSARDTYVAYKVSRDNGKTWGSEEKLNSSLVDNYRGNISPGQMCVPQSGLLKGKAFAVFRTIGYSNSSTLSGTSRLYLLAFDQATDSWANVMVKSAKKTNKYIQNAKYDEAQLVEVGENSFVLSVRYSENKHRMFCRITVKKSGNSLVATVTEVSMSGMTSSVACNGAIVDYTDATNKSYVMHTLPHSYIADGTNAGGRSGLSFYYADKTTSGSIAWNKTLCLSDPFDTSAGGSSAVTGTTYKYGYLDEASQYSSMTVLSDGTIGVAYEGYPIAFRQGKPADCGVWGDWVMGQFYLNLRVEDLMASAETPAVKSINPPVITPESQTYDSHDTSARPSIVVSHNNYVNLADFYSEGDVTTSYAVEYAWYDAQNNRNYVSADIKTFTAASESLTWAQAWALVTDKNANAVAPENANSAQLRISAYCSADNGETVSSTTVANYKFVTPVRNIKVVCVPSTGAAQEVVLASDIASVGADEWLTAGVDQTIQLTAPANKLFSFKGYYKVLNGDEVASPFSETELVPISGIRHQVTFNTSNMQYSTIDGVDDAMVIYAFYEANAAMATRVNTQYNTYTNSSNPYVSYASWYTPAAPTENSMKQNVKRNAANTAYPSAATMTGGETYSSTLAFASPSSQDYTAQNDNHSHASSTATLGTLFYPNPADLTNSGYAGVDAYVTILPDAMTATNFNAIVAVKRRNPSEATASANSYEYLKEFYVLQGRNNPLGSEIVAAANEGHDPLFEPHVMDWYTMENGTLLPTVVGMTSFQISEQTKDGITTHEYHNDSPLRFENIYKKKSLNDEDDEPYLGEVEVEIYIVRGNLTSVSFPLSKSDYLYKVSHKIVMADAGSGVITGINDVTDAKSVQAVVYYNMLGMSASTPFDGVNVVKTFYTDGTSATEKRIF